MPDMRSPSWLCLKCKQRERETFEPVHEDDDGYQSPYCGPCNDRSAESYREQQEFNHYHPRED
jgi:hypothetical protein